MKVAIIHPWFPQYRIGFFAQLIEKCASQGIDLHIFHGDPPPEWRGRNDSSSSQSITRLKTKFFRFRGKTLSYKSLREFHLAGPFDLVILEQAVRNLETFRLLFSGEPIAYWGHGKTYTTKINARQEGLKQRLTKGGRWFFSYTQGGVDAVVASGFLKARTTVVQNSIDTRTLQQMTNAVKQQQLEEIKRNLDLRGKTAAFIGGLDSSKRIQFLLEAASVAHSIDPDFRLIVAGAGVEQKLVENFSKAKHFIHYVGPLFDKDKALILRASQIISMPGRVGLVAVDSFATQTPIVTTDWEWHAPEFEYLVSGVNSLITPNSIEAYSDGLIYILNNKPELETLRKNCLEDSEKYTVEAMVENFVGGLKKALGTKA